MVVCKYLALLFVEVLPKLSFLLFFKAVVSFSISLTSVFYRAADETLDVLENDTKANFQKNFSGKVRFQKKVGYLRKIKTLVY